MRRHGRAILLTVVVIAFLAVLGVTIVHKPAADTGTTTSVSDVLRTIPVDGGTLTTEVVTPRAGHRAPLVVMPGGWGQPATEYRAIATGFATRGYQVVAYAQRGFSTSSGEVDFAGPQTQADARAVVDWALAHTKADPGRIGMFGISYGAGISLLAAAKDPRIKAVTALSTWTDVGDTFDPGNTPSTAALASLIGSGSGKDRFGPVVRDLQRALKDAPRTVGTAVRRISDPRSPMTYLADYNRNGTAILIANAFEDSIFGPAQLVPFYEALTTPKRLELSAGDHGGPERAALAGSPNQVVDDAQAWLDHYLTGAANGIAAEPPVMLRDVRTNELATFGRWPATQRKDRIALGRPGTAELDSTKTSTWRVSKRTGTDSGATSGPIQFLSAQPYTPPQVDMAAVSQSAAYTWIGPAQTVALRLDGTPSIDLTVGSSASTVTLFAYLYDVSGTTGTLVSAAPYTVRGLKRGEQRPVTIPLQPIAWTVPTNDHAVLVVDTVDPRFQSLTPAGATVTLASTTAHPARFDLPVQ